MPYFMHDAGTGTGTGTGAERECQAAVDTSRDELGDLLARVAAAQLFSSTLYLEGGAIEVNGQDLALVSQPLIKRRNPGVGRTGLETAFRALPGISKVTWLADGLASDPHLRATITGHCVAWGTGSLTDEFVRVADARTVLLTWPDEAEVAAHPVARLNRQRMQRHFDIVNRVVVVPGYEAHGTPRAAEQRVSNTLEQVLPGCRAVFLDALGANWVVGGPHCVSLNEPAL